MTDEILEQDKLTVLSDATTPIVFPPNLEMSDEEFYQTLRNAITLYQLPVECAECSFRNRDSKSVQKKLLISPQSHEVRHFKILIGFAKFGGLAYIDRKHIFSRPDLPPELTADSEELPPRLMPDSPELPPRTLVPAPAPAIPRPAIPGQYKGAAHEERVRQMEVARQTRRKLMMRRQEERLKLFSAWLNELSGIIDRMQRSAEMAYFTDSVDRMIRIVVEEQLEAKGAKAKEMAETVREKAELEEMKKKAKQEFF